MPIALSTQPVRKGAIYCSPRCGGNCKHKDYLLAVKTAAAMADELGPGWKPVVFENMGWYAQSTFPAFANEDRIFVSCDLHMGITRRYMCIINGVRSVSHFSKTTRGAYKGAYNKLMQLLQETQRDVAILPKPKRKWQA